MSPLFSGTLRLFASGPLSVDEVWERYTQPFWWPRWAPHLRQVEYHEPAVVPGTEGRVRGVAGIVADFRINAVDEAAHTWSWSVHSGPVRVSFQHGVDAGPSGSAHASTAWLETHGLWPVVLGYAPIARYSLGRLVSRG